MLLIMFEQETLRLIEIIQTFQRKIFKNISLPLSRNVHIFYLKYKKIKLNVCYSWYDMAIENQIH